MVLAVDVTNGRSLSNEAPHKLLSKDKKVRNSIFAHLACCDWTVVLLKNFGIIVSYFYQLASYIV